MMIRRANGRDPSIDFWMHAHEVSTSTGVTAADMSDETRWFIQNLATFCLTLEDPLQKAFFLRAKFVNTKTMILLNPEKYVHDDPPPDDARAAQLSRDLFVMVAQETARLEASRQKGRLKRNCVHVAKESPRAKNVMTIDKGGKHRKIFRLIRPSEKGSTAST